MLVKAFLNPNPEFQGEVLLDPHNRKIEIKNSPFLEIELINFPQSEFEISIISPFRLTKKAKINSTSFSVFFVDKRFQNPWISQIKAEISSHSIRSQYNLPLNIQQLTGIVLDFEDKPTSAYIWATQNKAEKYKVMVKTDDQGNFNLFYPTGKKLRAFVADSRYGQEILECWIMANDLKNNVRIDPHIGDRMELYEFKVWYFDGIWNIFFLPAVVDKTFPPPLGKDNIRVWFNDLEGKINSFTFHKVFYRAKKAAYYPAYIISAMIDKPLEEMNIPVKIRTLIDVPGSGKGESWFLYYPD